MSDVRVRFCPSPTGNPHVGMARTALFNWAFARRHGGTFVFRIEDTDAARNTEESYRGLIDALRWLNLDWDEGPEVGGPYGPYRQSERLDLYADVANQLVTSGLAYNCYCSTEELEARRELAAAEHRPPGYDGHCRELSHSQVSAYQREGRMPVVRLRMPDGEISWADLVRGDVTFPAGQVPDFVMVRANGDPLYTLTNPVDDAAMRISHVLRGEDLLSSTPRQLALWDALHVIGFSNGVTPQFGHLPYVMGEGNKKLSKRDPESSLQMYIDGGYVTEGVANYLALLGWSLSEDRDRFSLQEMAEAFDISRVNASPARFDLKKCTALNGDWIRMLPLDVVATRMVPLLQRFDVVDDPPTDNQLQVLTAALPLVHERMQTLVEGVEMLRFLFIPDEEFVLDPTDAKTMLGQDSIPVLDSALTSLTALTDWTHAGIEHVLRAALIDTLQLKPKVAFGPLRVAVTGRRISPPLFESLELLGQTVSLRRLDHALGVAREQSTSS